MSGSSEPGAPTSPGLFNSGTAIREWRVFMEPRYRRFQGIGGSGAVVAALAGDGLTIPLLLALGASPAVATVIGVMPFAFSAAQLSVPWLLRRFDGNLRGVTLVILALGRDARLHPRRADPGGVGRADPRRRRDPCDRDGHEPGRGRDHDRWDQPAGVVRGDHARRRASLRRTEGDGPDPGPGGGPAAAGGAHGPGPRAHPRAADLRGRVPGQRHRRRRGDDDPASADPARPGPDRPTRRAGQSGGAAVAPPGALPALDQRGGLRGRLRSVPVDLRDQRARLAGQLRDPAVGDLVGGIARVGDCRGRAAGPWQRLAHASRVLPHARLGDAPGSPRVSPEPASPAWSSASWPGWPRPERRPARCRRTNG